MTGSLNISSHTPRLIIDGAGVPVPIYLIVKHAAVADGQTRFIGFIYRRPRSLRVERSEPADRWGLKLALANRQQEAGVNCEWIIGCSREELLAEYGAELSMILWISPEVYHAGE